MSSQLICSPLEVLSPGTYPPKSESLTVWYRGGAVLRVAAVWGQVLVRICLFGVQICV